MTHPLTAMVHGLLDFKCGIDRYDVAIALGAPDNNPDAWGVYLQTAAHVLDCMTREGNLYNSNGGMNPIYVAVEPPIYKKDRANAD